MQTCNHVGFTTQVGCRKHIKNKHEWYFHFDEKPNSSHIESFHNQGNKNEANDQLTLRKIRTVASSDMSSNVAQEFFSWLTGSGGGCKSDRPAQQIVSRCFKFLKFCCEMKRSSHSTSLTLVYVLPISFFKFVYMKQDEWKLGHAGRLGYLNAIAELGDFKT